MPEHGSIEERRDKLHWLLFIVAGTLALSLLASNAYRLARRSLAAYPEWRSMKPTMTKRLIPGTINFIRHPMPMRGGALNVSRWWGYQEVERVETISADELELRIRMEPKAHVTLLWRNEGEPARQFITLGGPKARSHSHGAIGDDYRFAASYPLEAPRLKRNEWSRVMLRSVPEGCSLSIDGVAVTLPLCRFGKRIRFALRGSLKSAEVDDIRFSLRGTPVLEESFGGSRLLVSALAVTLPVALLFMLGVTALLRREAGPRLKSAVLLSPFWVALLLLVGNVQAYLYAQGYPSTENNKRDKEGFFTFQRRDIEAIRAELAKPPGPGLVIATLGGSQMWGSGASHVSRTLAAKLEDALHARLPGVNLDLVNLGINAATTTDMIKLMKSDFESFRPDVVLLNFGHNDVGSGKFETNLERLAGICTERGASLIFSKEAISPDLDRPLAERFHPAVERVAAKLGAPIIDLHGCLERRFGEGLLWWDRVHMTDAGQAIAAECLAAELSQLIVAVAGGRRS